jgi:hypothetical protein
MGTLVPRNVNEAVVGSVGVCTWQESGVLSEAAGFVLMRLARMWFQST